MAGFADEARKREQDMNEIKENSKRQKFRAINLN